MHSSSTTELGEPGENMDVFALASSINCKIHIYDAKYLDGNSNSCPLKICPGNMLTEIPIVLIRHMDNDYNSACVMMASAPRGNQYEYDTSCVSYCFLWKLTMNVSSFLSCMERNF